jgi:hypothetical protein
MNASESDLRAALHSDETSGASLDVDHLMASAQAHVARRRVRILTGAAAVAVVAGLGTGLGLVANGTGSTSAADKAQRGAGGADSARNPAYGQSAGASAANGGSAAMADAIACPPTPPIKSQVTGKPGASGSETTSLFRTPVRTIVVCAYGSAQGVGPTSATHPARLVLTGASAGRLVASLPSATESKPAVMCPLSAGSDTRVFALVGIAADGSPAGTLVAVLGPNSCSRLATRENDGQVQWTPPPDLRKRLLALSPTN